MFGILLYLINQLKTSGGFSLMSNKNSEINLQNNKISYIIIFIIYYKLI